MAEVCATTVLAATAGPPSSHAVLLEAIEPGPPRPSGSTRPTARTVPTSPAALSGVLTGATGCGAGTSASIGEAVPFGLRGRRARRRAGTRIAALTLPEVGADAGCGPARVPGAERVSRPTRVPGARVPGPTRCRGRRRGGVGTATPILRVERRLDGGRRRILRVAPPAVLSVESGIAPLRRPAWMPVLSAPACPDHDRRRWHVVH